jgi:NADPH:quinone reductase-like Zn-dependent oxidoreductase
VNIAVDDGLHVVATTRDPGKEALLRELGATEVLIDDGDLAAQVANRGIVVDAVLDLVGNSVLRDSLLIVRPRGRVCQVGILGGLSPVVYRATPARVFRFEDIVEAHRVMESNEANGKMVVAVR